MRTDAVLDIRGFSKSYGEGTRAVDDVSLRVMPGDIYGFIGHNGAGKTTLIRSVVGVLDFTEGEILVDGHSVRREPLACKRVSAYLPDNPDIYESLTGIQYLNFVADAFGLGALERTAEIARWADLFEITDALGDLIGSYSHGMRQKVVVVSALIHHPRLMVLDEPFVGLDPKATFTLKEAMREMCSEGGAVFFSTHVLDVAERLCNKVAIIRRGKIVAAGPISELTAGHSLEETFLEALDA